jgi:hypothetical protein
MTPEVQAAIAEVARAFPEHGVRTLEEPQGGAYVIVDDLPVGPAHEPATSWMGFLISFQHPRAQVYPHWLRADLRRADGTAFAPPIHPGQTMPGFNLPAVMVSRGSNAWNPATDTPVLKLMRVLEWLRSRS